MNRVDMLAAARDGRTWDVLVIGGGATGLGTAVDAAARGYDTLLLEAAADLARRFRENFAAYDDEVSEEVRAAGPSVD